MNNKNNKNLVTPRHLLWVLMLMTLPLFAAHAQAENDYDRERFITGYVAALLESEFSLQPDQYRIEVDNDVLEVMVYDPGKNSIPAMEKVLLSVEERFKVRSSVLLANRPGTISNRIVFPEGYLFKPLLASPKEARFSASLVRANMGPDDLLVATVGLGHDFGLVRWPLGDGDAWQFSIFAAAFSQFNMDSESDDLMNTDYQIGFPLTFRYGSVSGRFRVFHQSSHLGDELILGGYGPERVGLSVEVVDFLVARDIDDWRVYGGGAYVIRTRDPEDLKRGIMDFGFDYASSQRLFLGQRVVAGINVNAVEERDWHTGTSLKVGLAFGRSYPNPRGASLMLEAYNGVVPFGQFYVDDIRYFGLGLSVDM